MYRHLWILSEPASETREIDDLNRLSSTGKNWAEGPQSNQLKFSHYVNVGSREFPLWVPTGWKVQTDGSVFRRGQLSFWGAQDMRYTNVLFWPTITTSLQNPINVNSLFSQKTKMSASCMYFPRNLSSYSLPLHQWWFGTSGPTLDNLIWQYRSLEKQVCNTQDIGSRDPSSSLFILYTLS